MAHLIPLFVAIPLGVAFLIPMVISLAFGVLFATGVTLILVPALYFFGERFRARFSSASEPLADLSAL